MIHTCRLLLVALAAAFALPSSDVCSTREGRCTEKATAAPAQKQAKATAGNLLLQLAGTKIQSKTLSEDEDLVSVVSYNLYWWNVAERGRWPALHSVIADAKPFELIGFQECENVRTTLEGAALDGFEFYQGPNKPDFNPAPLAWSSAAFAKLSGPGYEKIGEDKWGARILTWVRLRHLSTDSSVFFANTHGPLGDCGEELGNNWVAAVEEHKQSGDAVVLTGDFNCIMATTAMQKLRALLAGGVVDTIDHILSNRVSTEGGRKEGWPSDHPLVWGRLSLSADVGSSHSKRACGEVEENVDYKGGDLRSVSGITSSEDCSAACKDDLECKSFTYASQPHGCYLKRFVKPGRHVDSCCTSGLPACEPKSLEKSFDHHSGYNCFSGAGASPVPGKEMAEVKSLEACQEECAGHPQCEGILMSPRGNSGRGKCWLRKDVDLGACKQGTRFDVWLKRS